MLVGVVDRPITLYSHDHLVRLTHAVLVQKELEVGGFIAVFAAILQLFLDSGWQRLVVHSWMRHTFRVVGRMNLVLLDHCALVLDFFTCQSIDQLLASLN